MSVFWSAGLLGGLGLGAYGVSRYGLREPRGLPRALAAVVLGWAWLTVGTELLGALGLLTRGPLAAWVALGLAAAGWCRLRAAAESPVVRSGPWPVVSWEEVATAGLVAWVAAAYGAVSLLRAVKVVSDGPIYHLYFAARWWKSGSLAPVAAPFGENAATYFPATGDLWFTGLMVAWGGDRLARVGQVPFAAAAGLAVVALARRLGAGRSAALLAAAWFLTSTPVFIFTFEPNVDTIFVAGYLLACYFFLRHALGDDGNGSLVLGSLAAGCALGAKAPAVLFVPPLLLLGTATALRRGRHLRERIVGLLAVVAPALAVSGFWYARNAAWTGNPLYPLHVTAFGRVWLRGWYGPDVMRLSPYYLPVSDWRSLVDMLLAVLDPRLAPLWLASVAGAWALGRTGAPNRVEDRFVWLAAGLAVVNVGLFWLGVPYRTQQRFMVQALGLAAVPLARAFDRSAVLRALGVGLLAAHLVTPQGWPLSWDRSPPWDLSTKIPNAVPSLIRLPTRHDLGGALGGDAASALAVGVPVLAGSSAFVAALAWARAGSGRGRAWVRWSAAAAATLALLTVSALPVYPWGEDDRRRFFPRFPDYYRGWMALDRASGPGGTRVAYAGTNIPYYLMGAGLRNDVRYVNVDAHRDWLLHDYHRAAVLGGHDPPTWDFPRPGWDRIHPDYEAWLANLRAEDVRLLVVTRADPDNGPHNVADREGFPIERRWADGHPDVFEPLYGAADGDRLFRLYRVKPAPSVSLEPGR